MGWLCSTVVRNSKWIKHFHIQYTKTLSGQKASIKWLWLKYVWVQRVFKSHNTSVERVFRLKGAPAVFSLWMYQTSTTNQCYQKKIATFSTRRYKWGAECHKRPTTKVLIKNLGPKNEFSKCYKLQLIKIFTSFKWLLVELLKLLSYAKFKIFPLKSYWKVLFSRVPFAILHIAALKFSLRIWMQSCMVTTPVSQKITIISFTSKKNNILCINNLPKRHVQIMII